MIGRPTTEQLARITEKHGLGRLPVRPVRSTGVVNWIYAVGDDAILRIPRRSHPDGVRDTLTESVAVPAVRAGGIRTPALLAFDDSYEVVDVPFTIYERVPGRDLSSWDNADSHRIYHELGRELARLHRDVTEVADPEGRLDTHDRWKSPDFLQQGLLDQESAAAVAALFEHVQPMIKEAEGFRRFLHQDLKPDNIMAVDSAFTAIIDWGDAGWGDPALDFRYLPVDAVESALTGYREIMPLDGDETAEARILWDQVCSAVYEDQPANGVARILGSDQAQRWLARTLPDSNGVIDGHA